MIGKQPRLKNDLKGDRKNNNKNANNNINININFNVKDKAQGFGGKKIDNFVEVVQKPKNQIMRPSAITETLKTKKKTIDKEKGFSNPQHGGFSNPQHTSSVANMKKKRQKLKNNNEFTPEKKKVDEREIDRFKTVEKKSRRESKSVKNLRQHFKQKPASKSESASRSKERSRSQSSKKLIKKPKFENSGIKYRFEDEWMVPKNKKLEAENEIEKHNDSEKLKCFMNQKKKKEKKEKERKLRQKKEKESRLKQDLKKLEVQRKRNASKSISFPYKKWPEKKEDLFPLQYDDDDGFDQDTEYIKLKEKAQQLIYNNTQKSAEKPQFLYSNQKSQPKHTDEKSHKERPIDVVKIAQKHRAAVKIQSLWRGYRARIQFLSDLNLLCHQNEIKKKKLVVSHLKLWKEESENSIQQIEQVQVDEIYIQDLNLRDSQNESNNFGSSTAKMDFYKPGAQQQNYKPEVQQQYHSGSSSQINHRKYEDFHEYHRPSNSLSHDSSIFQEMEKLKGTIQEQQLKNRLLEQENETLKASLRNSSLQSSHIKQSDQLAEDQVFQESREQVNEQVQVNESVENESNLEEINDSKSEDRQKGKSVDLKEEPVFERFPKKQLQIISVIDEGNYGSLADMRQKMQAFECSSPSYFLKSPKVRQFFSKKEDSLDNLFEEKSETFLKLYNEQMLSPKAYEVRVKELENYYRQEKKILSTRKEEAERVCSFIKNEKIPVIEFNESKPEIKIEKHEIQNKQRQIPKQQSKIEEEQLELPKEQNKLTKEWNELEKDQEQAEDENKFQKSELKAFWDCNIDEIHQHTLDISKRIDMALEEDKDQHSPKQDKSDSEDQHYHQIQLKQHEEEMEQSGDFHKESDDQNENEKVLDIFRKLNNSQQKDPQQEQEQQQQEQQQQEQEFAQQQLAQQEQQIVRTFPKGFQTSLTFIKQYCIGLCQFIRADHFLKAEFIDSITSPLKHDLFEYLKAYRTTLEGENSKSYNSHQKDFIYPYFKLICPKQISITHESFQKFNQAYDQSLQTDITPEMDEIRKFYLISVIDAFNESLNYERPGSVYGQALQWLPNTKQLKNFSISKLGSSNNFQANEEDNEQEQKFDQIFGVAIAKLIQWGTCLCGFIPEPISMEMEENQVLNIDEEQTEHIRETRMALMLEKALLDDEEKMTDFTTQQTEVRLFLGEVVYEMILAEALQEISQLEEV